MSDLIKKSNEWLSNLTKRDSSYEKQGIRPTRDWEIILSTTVVIVALLALAAGYFYVQVNQGHLFQVPAEDIENEVKINKTLLDKTIADINERRKAFEAVQQGGAVSADPSM